MTQFTVTCPALAENLCGPLVSEYEPITVPSPVPGERVHDPAEYVPADPGGQISYEPGGQGSATRGFPEVADNGGWRTWKVLAVLVRFPRMRGSSWPGCSRPGDDGICSPGGSWSGTLNRRRSAERLCPGRGGFRRGPCDRVKPYDPECKGMVERAKQFLGNLVPA